MNDGFFMNGFGMGMGYNWIIPILVILTLVYFFSNTSTTAESAKDILDKKYAKGEISEDEYTQKKKLLNN